MFITNQLTPAEMLSELLSIKGYRRADTERFRGLEHNDDLCPRFTERVSAMLDAYMSHRTNVLDTQGPRDEGVDVMLNYEDGGSHRLGLQIKSYREIDKWAKGRDDQFIQRLKAQYTSAMQNARVEYYYLMLCTDETEHKKQIRTISSELKLFERLKIICPRRALAFYEMGDDQIRAFVTRLLCNDDSVLEAARNEINGMPGDLAHFTVALICRGFDGDTIISDEDLDAIHQEWLEIDPDSDPNGDRISELVGELDGAGLSVTSEGYYIDIRTFPDSLCAVYFDQKQRHDGDMLARLTALLGIVTPGRTNKRLGENPRGEDSEED